VDTNGKVDSIWITPKASRGIDEVTKYVLHRLSFNPARKGKKKIPFICRLSFHYRIKE
jgi:hypothetical protein